MSVAARKAKHEMQVKFTKFTKDKTNTHEAKKELAKKLYDDYQPYLVESVTNEYNSMMKAKVMLLERNELGINKRRRLSFSSQLRLRHTFNIIMVLLTMMFLIASITFAVLMPDKSEIFAGALLISFALGFIEYYRSHRYTIRTPYKDVEQIKSFIWKMNYVDTVAANNIYYKNGKVKHGKYKEHVTEQYKMYIVSKMENPYKASSEKFPLHSKSFRKSGGVYAWWHNGRVVYVGLTNNFHNRMAQHCTGFFKMESTERKYNAYDVRLSEIMVQIIAETDCPIEQRVLESYYYYKHNKPHLNSCEPTKFDRILSEQKYRVVWDRIKNKVDSQEFK